MPISGILTALQACIIYLIMCIIDPSPESEELSLELVIVLHDLYVVAKQRSVRHVMDSELSMPSVNWEDWIFAESQRRCALSILSVPRSTLANRDSAGSRICGSSLAVSCVRRPEYPAIPRKAIDISLSQASNLSGKRPQRLLGRRSMRLAACFNQAV
jgi:hypothetical protein